MDKIQRTTIKGLCQNRNGEVLIAKSKRDEYWELPGGKIEFGEQPEQTLSREVKEEFAIKNFKIIRLLDAFSFNAIDENTHWDFLVIVYLCKLENNNLEISDEHEEFAWVLPENISNYLMRNGYYKIIKSL